MAMCLLVRHGHSSANQAGVLAGWSPSVGLTEKGRDQARKVGEALRGRPIARVLASPLQRCQETVAEAVPGVPAELCDDLGECHYGAWTGRALSELVGESLWRTVQDDPASARFPASPTYAAESLTEMAERVWSILTRVDAEVEREHGTEAVWVAVSHGDPIRSALARAMSAGLPGLQRVQVDPGSVSCLRWSSGVPFVVGSNGDAGCLERWLAAARHTVPAGDSVPGGEV